MRWIDVGGISLRYAEQGDGPTMLLIHEIGGSLESWDDVVAPLATRFRVVRYDQRGAGGSEKMRSPFGLAELVGDARGLLEQIGLHGPYHLVGAAMGAAQALMLAASVPGEIASLALLAPALDIDDQRAEVMERRAERAATEGIRAVLPMTLDRAWPAHARPDAMAFTRHRGRYLANDPVSFGLHNRALLDVAVDEIVITLRCPTLVLAGRDDQVRPPELVRPVAEAIADARFEVLDTVHFMAPHAPRLVADRLMAFYDALVAPERPTAIPAARGGAL